MADRTGLARKRELAGDQSVLSEAADLPIVDSADVQILDDQAVQDILEPDHKFDLAATFVPLGGLANRIALRQALDRLERDTEGTNSQRHDRTPVTHSSLRQRASEWFRRN
jgi:hypothetical protein